MVTAPGERELRSERESDYDWSYFEGGSDGPGYDSYHRARGIVGEQFRMIHDVLGTRVPFDRRGHLDVGCAYGFGVETMTRLGWDSQGFDLSEWAVAQARELWGVRYRIRLGDVTDPGFWTQFPDGGFGLSTAIELFEHVPLDSVSTMLDGLARVSQWGAFLVNARTVPGQADDGATADRTHLTHHTVAWWMAALERYGEVDHHAVFEFNRKAMAKYPEVDWLCRCIVVRFG